MNAFFSRIFNTDDFPARWHCGNWTPGHGWLHIGSDIAVWLAYFTIPCVLIYFAARKEDLPFRRVFWLFGAFILACGTTHLMEAVIFWWPAYRLAGLIKLLTAVVSWGTVIALVPIIPQVLAMRSPNSLEQDVEQRTAELHQANDALRREVMERRHVENALREQREWLRVILSSIGDAVIATDSRGRITFMNTAAEALTGWQAEQAETRPLESVFQIVPHDPEAIDGDPFERALSGRSGIGLTEQSTIISRNGRRMTVEDNYAPIRDENGAVRGVVLAFRDVTERLRAEQRIQLLARAGESLVTYFDADQALQEVARMTVPNLADWCCIETINEQGAVERDVRVHADPQREPALHAAPRKPSDAAIAMTTLVTNDAVTAERALPFDLALTADGALPPLRSLIRVPITVHGRAVGTFTMAFAESDRSYTADDAALAEELARRTAFALENARLYEQLRDADRRKNEFLAMLAHELRNPIAPVRNALTILTGSETDEATRRELQTVMVQQFDQIIRLVDDLLDVSRIMRGRIELRCELIRLHDVIERAVQTVRPLCDEKGQRLQIDPVSESVCVKGDLVRLSQVVFNLLHNAAKYSPHNTTIHLSVGCEPHGIAVRIRDEGMGIEADMLSKIFDLFTQTDRSAERASGGLGIGLTVVRNIVEMHGGTIEAHSDGLDRGSEFVIRLARDESQAEVQEQRWKPTPMPPLRVMVVEDNVGSARTLALMLKKFWNHEVVVAHDGLKALELAESFRPELILMDIGLPNLDGYEVVSRLRAVRHFANMSIIALTGYGQVEDRRRSREVGFDDHLIKPVAVEVLEMIFAKVVNRPRSNT